MTRSLHFHSCIDWLDAAWRVPAETPARLFDLQQVADRARLAERGLMDAMFIADFYTYRPRVNLEPLTLLSALAACTTRIGLVASVSTTYNEPYDLARMFASLDHLSGGRAGWNMVTTAVGTVSANYSREEHLEHDSRYARAQEFVEVVTALWDSWEDAPGGGEARPIGHEGDWFSVRGPLNVPRPPQGHPVRCQAGASDAGRDFAARWAEVIFTAQPLLPVAQEFYADLKARLPAHGRAEADMVILPGLLPLLAETAAEAKDMAAARQAAQPAEARRMEELLGFALSALPMDEPIPLEVLPARSRVNGMRGRSELYLSLIRKHRLTPRQVLNQDAHLGFAGDPLQTADLITKWFLNRGCDGFTLMWPTLRANELFVEKVIPLLQERGLYRTAYEGTTLRDHYGFRPPPGRLDVRGAA
ncbi:NtaA/DmoA family FMN-dependent monooxygenase [Roseococcus pinisoli]|uniref:NtaA/DmoA family FMN-dependent monooxygenase n=1 Tax=Roseococcus pinisoli TaxID=2835040 RepID=A0ABS5QIX0_9PROT|nr:NtaA/DmoA family FMN-dependent monooxygenase [Roseococcus pinisoli]MBS7813630.1 NtaA/DmoA family FMN-dependent monooxygenase [Roseococcus pinisoli]